MKVPVLDGNVGFVGELRAIVAARTSNLGVVEQCLATCRRCCVHRGAGTQGRNALDEFVELLRPSVLHARVTGTPEAIDMVEVGGAVVIAARDEFRC